MLNIIFPLSLRMSYAILTYFSKHLNKFILLHFDVSEVLPDEWQTV